MSSSHSPPYQIEQPAISSRLSESGGAAIARCCLKKTAAEIIKKCPGAAPVEHHGSGQDRQK